MPLGSERHQADRPLDALDGELARFGEAAGDQLIETGDINGDGSTSLVMFNQGLQIGQMELRSADGYPNFILNDGSWFTRGESQFFGDGLGGIGDVLLNTGLVQASFIADRSSTTTFRSLNHTINAGVVSLLDGGFDTDETDGVIDNVEGDSINFGGDYYGGLGEIAGLGGGEYEETPGYFALDAFLAGGAFENIGEADFFDIWGDLSGQTELIIRIDPTSEEYAGVNQSGILVVQADSLNQESHFFGGGIGEAAGTCDNAENICKSGDVVSISAFSPGYDEYGDIPVIEQGFYAWYLAREGEDFELRSTFGANAANAAGITTGAQNIFYETLNVVQDHSYAFQFAPSGGAGADLPMEAPVYEPVTASAAPTTGLWAKISGSHIDGDATLDLGVLGEQDSDTDQEVYSILGGADMRFSPDSPFRFGLFGGYVTSNLDFDLGSSSVDYEGGVLGAYGAWNNGAWYADVTVKGDLLNTEYSFDGTDVDADVWNAGVAANTGYRFNMGPGFFEPIASFAYVHTSVDDVTSGTGSVSFSEGDSLRAGAGARIGTSFATGGAITELSVLGKVWNEFEDANEITVSDGVNTSTFSDDISGLFGEASATLMISNADRSLSGFVTGGGKWGDNFNSYNAQVGVRAGF
jgi:hypothetical protein